MGPVAQRNATNGRTGRPPVTSRAQILVAARQLIDRDGWEKLTVRRLAAELGIGPTTMYHHVRDKEDLLLLLLSEYAAQIPRPDLPSDPRDRVVAAGLAIHDALADWPWAAEVLTADGFMGLIGPSAHWMVETIVAATVEAGRTPDEAVYVFRTIWYYTVGEILVRAHSPRRPLDRDPFFTTLDSTQTPHLAAIANNWPTLAAQNTYPQGLQALVNGLLPRD